MNLSILVKSQRNINGINFLLSLQLRNINVLSEYLNITYLLILQGLFMLIQRTCLSYMMRTIFFTPLFDRVRENIAGHD